MPQSLEVCLLCLLPARAASIGVQCAYELLSPWSASSICNVHNVNIFVIFVIFIIEFFFFFVVNFYVNFRCLLDHHGVIERLFPRNLNHDIRFKFVSF